MLPRPSSYTSGRKKGRLAIASSATTVNRKVGASSFGRQKPFTSSSHFRPSICTTVELRESSEIPANRPVVLLLLSFVLRLSIKLDAEV